MQRHALTDITNHNRSPALERSVKSFYRGGGGGGAGFKSILRGRHPRPYFDVVYTSNLLSLREGFLNYQCNIFEYIKPNKFRDETTLRTTA